MKLTAVQEEHIINMVNQHRLTINGLRDDLIDHLCCVVEKKMSEGADFERSVNQALVELAPDGLREIEAETFYLFNSYKIIFMKKFIYFIGMVSAMAMSIGFVGSLLRYTGGQYLSAIGTFIFVFTFLPILAVKQHKIFMSKPLSERLRFYFGFISAEVLGLAVAMKLLHLQGTDLVLGFGALIFTFGFLPFLFLSMYKKAAEQV
jgi:hypothetical protein